MTDTLDTTRFRVEGMDCAACATKIDTAVRRIGGVQDVSVSVVRGTMTVQHAATVDLEAISQKVTSLGYRTAALPPKPAVGAPASTEVEDNHSGHDHSHAGHDHSDHDHAEHDHGDNDHAGHDHGAKPVSAAISSASAKSAPPADALEGMHGHDNSFDEGPWWRTRKARMTITTAAAVAVAFIAGRLIPDFAQWAFVAAMLVGLVPIARRAYAGAVNGSPFSIETLMTVAAVGAVFINAAEEASVVVLFFLVGELLEGVATGRARASIRALADLVPKVALREVAGKTAEVPAESLVIGDIILIRPGDRVPADGVIVSGESALDEAPVTGESVPKTKKADDPVFAGTINQEGALRVRVSAAAADNTISRIIALVEEAQESKAPTERFIDQFSKYYTPAVMVVSALIAVIPPLFFGQSWNEWIYKGLAVLLIGCPCALVISTPAAIAAALSAGARRGLLMKGGAVLEQLGKINMVALDKTGTLTLGKPQVTDVIGVSKTERETMELAAALEVGSSHPLASAILAKAKSDGIELAQASKAGAVGGKGVVGTVNGIELFLGSPKSAAEKVALGGDIDTRIIALNDEGKTVSVLLANGAIAGIIAMRDEPRPDAVEGLKALRALGADIVMLTGDNKRTAAAIGKALGIEPRGELLPEDKQRIVGELKASGKIVAKVGDGINDAPALAAANIGIAMGGGTDVALETADAAVLHGRVIDVANMILLSRSTMSNITQNITISLGLKAFFLVTTVIGVTGLWPAILADTGATVLVTANAMRLLGWKGLGGKA
jgi:Cd2+/Zn2+-exporting ATPase